MPSRGAAEMLFRLSRNDAHGEKGGVAMGLDRGRRTRRALVSATITVAVLIGYLRLAPLEPPEAVGALPGTVVLDAQGGVLQRDAREGVRIPVRLGQVAPLLVQATISAEDRRFLQHPGLDPIAVARATINLGAQRSGASTITQQLARRLYLEKDGGPLLVRKLREALIALQLEARRSKGEILERYLNEVYYGRGAHGIEAAARVYFGTSARDLDLAHAAYLAGLPQRPSAYDPTRDPASARARQAYVLRRMVEDGRISPAEADAALAQDVATLPAVPAPVAQHFVAYALAELVRIRPDLAGRRGLVVETSLDGGLQSEAERLARLHLAKLAERNVTNAAVVVVEPGSGRILAMVGSATSDNPAHGGAINMALQPRQPGSALKPFLYAAAFERGRTPATPLLDIPTTFRTDRGPYAPLNSDRTFHGLVPLRTALGSSLNVPAVRTLEQLGLDAMLEIAHRFGLTTLSEAERYGLSLTLGGGEVRLLDLAAAYAALGASGELAEPFAVVRVRDREGRIVYERHAATPRRVLSRQHAYLLADILSDASARVPTFGYVTPFDLPFSAAVKTGTTTGFRDNWTVGFTPDVAVGVWVGNADASPMQNLSGVDGAAPIWRDVMVASSLGRPMRPFVRPAGIVEVTVCAPTGLLPSADCPMPVREVFVSGTEPTARETYYGRAADGALAIDPPLEARAWARDAGLRLATDARPSARQAVRVVAPEPGSVFYLAPELVEQHLLLRATAAPGVERVAFDVDGAVVGEVAAGEAWIVWALQPGTHTVVARATLPSGRLASAPVTFEVRP